MNFTYGKNIHYCNKTFGSDNMTCKDWFDNRFYTSDNKNFTKEVKLAYKRFYDYQARKKKKNLITLNNLHYGQSQHATLGHNA